MNDIQIVDATTLCQSFPAIKPPVIPRDHILETLEMALGGDLNAISLEGPEGIGKTTTLALFAKRHYNDALSVFIRPSSRWAYDPSVLVLDLLSQAEWLLSGEVIRVEDLVPDNARLRT